MKVAIIVAQEKFNNTEFSTVINSLEKNSIPYEIASTSKTKAFGYGSFSVIPDIHIHELIVSNYDCFIIIGGSGCKKYLWKNPILHKKINVANKSNKILAAICLAPICFIYSKIIKKSFITAYKTKETMKIIKESGNFYKESDVFTIGNIITGNGPKASQKFCDAILSSILK